MTVFAQALLDRKKKVAEKEHDFKLTRYGCIVLLLQARLHWDDDKAVLRIHRPDIKSLNDLDNELKAELFNTVLFASQSVIETFSKFIQKPTCETFVGTASAMRKDLWGKSAKIKNTHFLIESIELSQEAREFQSGEGVLKEDSVR